MSSPTASSSPRADGRTPEQLRPLRFQNHIAPHAAGEAVKIGELQSQFSSDEQARQEEGVAQLGGAHAHHVGGPRHPADRFGRLGFAVHRREIFLLSGQDSRNAPANKSKFS